MSELFQRCPVQCPYIRAKDYLDKALSTVAQSREPQTLTLRVPLAGAHGHGLQKAVTVTYGIGSDPMHFDQIWQVHWAPCDGGPYPEFDGTLAVRADDTYEHSFLELRGAYRPPLGVPGAAFDAVLGSRIASLTARQLLGQLGHDMEARYVAEERAKHAGNLRR
ncbi:MAG: hypothetical protein ACYDG3_01940 [Bacillati bacterium]